MQSRRSGLVTDQYDQRTDQSLHVPTLEHTPLYIYSAETELEALTATSHTIMELLVSYKVRCKAD
jgi:hypothetical protein